MGAAAPQQSFSRSTSIAHPTSKEMKRMSKEEVEAFAENYLEEQRELLKNFDPAKLSRDPMIQDDMLADLVWQDVSFSVQVPDPDDPKSKKEKVLLEECHGHVKAGSLVAIMGPSGCGKSTLLDILAQKKTSKYTGEVYLNGHSIIEEPLLRRVAAYVGQEETMPEHWTAREAVTFNARLKKSTPSSISTELQRKMIDGLLSDVGLLHVADTKIGGPTVRGLSGGQKRRLALARAMAAGPMLMFCDEPTSGLSATDAELCIRALKTLTVKWGVTILVVIHQPRIEVANLFSHLILLTSQPGRVVYNGRMAEALTHIEKVGYPVPVGANFADHFLDLVTPGAPGAQPEKFRAYYVEHVLPAVRTTCADALENPRKDIMMLLESERDVSLQFGYCPEVRKSPYGVGFCSQVKILLEREIKLSLKDPTVVGMVGTQAVLGLVIGTIYFGVGQKQPQGMTQMGFFMMFLNMVTLAPLLSMPTLITQRLIMKLEISEKLYSEGAYVIAFLCVNMTLSLIGLLLLIVILFAMGQMPWRSFGNLFYWGVLNFLMMDAMVGLGTAVASNVEQANYVLMPFQIFAGLFNGFALTKVSAPAFLKWVFYISPVSYSMEDIAHFNYGKDPAIWNSLVEYNGLEWNDSTVFWGTSITVAFVVIGRVGQVLALKYLQNVQK